MGATRASVLIVDDDPELRDWIAGELASRDFAVERASSGPVALQVQSQQRFDLALIDLRMPGMDGIETLTALKQRDPDLEAVIATGHGTVPAAVASMKQGAFDFIQKPYTLRQLLPILERALDKSRLQATVSLHAASAALLETQSEEDLVPQAASLLRRMLRAQAGGIVLAKSARTLTYADEGTPIPPEALVEAMAGLLPAGATGMRLPESGARVTPVGAYGSAIVTTLSARNTRIGALVIFRDQSSTLFTAEEVRRAEIFSGQLALALDNARLHRELAEKVREVTRARDQLIFSEKLALTGQLTAGVAHEINTPLGFVRFNLDFVLTAAEKVEQGVTEGASPEELQQGLGDLKTAVADAREGVERIVKIVRSLNLFAQPDRTQEAALDLPKVLDWSANVASAHIRARARLTRNYEATPPVRGSETRLGQVFVNLLVNAAQAIEPEKSADNEISIRVRPEGTNVVVEVQDTGMGIDPALLERIFEPFFTTKPVGTGTGLGLSICRTIVSEHGGTLTVESTPGQGATFRVTLPVDQATMS